MEGKYELAVVLHPDLEINLEKPLSKLNSTIEKFGRIKSKEEWGKRKLAYPIKGQQFGLYYFYQLELPGASVGELERELIINEEILRHLIIKAPKIAVAAQKPAVEPEEKPKKAVEAKTKASLKATKE